MNTEIILRQHRRNIAADIIPCICRCVFRCVFNRPSLKTPAATDFTKLCRCVSDKARISQSPKTWLAGICREVEDTPADAPADVLITRWQRLGDYADKRAAQAAIAQAIAKGGVIVYACLNGEESAPAAQALYAQLSR